MKRDLWHCVPVMKLNAKIALITGGSRGLGRAAALQLADHGADVILTCRSGKDEAEAVAEEIRGKGRKAAALFLDTGISSSFPAFAEEVAGVLRETWGRDSF